MITVNCECCICYVNGICTNKREATYGSRINCQYDVTCQGLQRLPRDTFQKIKSIRKVKSIYDYEVINPKTSYYAVKY